MIKVLLLDDHAVVRAGFRNWINSDPGLQVVAEAATSAQACELLREQAVDVAVVDLTLKDDSGLEAIRRIRARSPRTQVMVLTMHAHEGYALQAIRLGAIGYLTKDSDPEQVLQALHQVAKGRHSFSPEVMHACMRAQSDRAVNPLAQLTPREFEVLRLFTEGLGTPDIASALHVSEKTVANTMSLVRQKLETRSDFALMRLVVEHGLLPIQG